MDQLEQVTKNAPMRWTDSHDSIFVREVLAHEPYSHKKGSPERKKVWDKLAETLNSYDKPCFRVTARAVRDHLNSLLDNFKRKMREEVKASGITDEESEVDHALQDILERFQEAEENTAQKKAKTENDAKKALEMRKRSLETFSETNERAEETTPKRSRNNGSETMTYLKEKSALELEFRKEELKVNSQLKKDEINARREEQKNMKDQFMAFQQQQSVMFQRLAEQQNNALALMQQNMNSQQQQQNLLLALIQKVIQE